MNETGHGLVIPDILTREQGAEHILGAIARPVINPSGKWDIYLPANEWQRIRGIEVFACTAYGSHNCIETLLAFHGVYNENYSDRALAIAAGIDPKIGGADPHHVIEVLRTELGCVPEALLPFSEDIKTVEDYYQPKPLPSSILSEGKKWPWKLEHDWVYSQGTPSEKKEKLREALTKGTVAVSVHAWVYENDKGYYYKPQGKTDNHWCQLVQILDDGTYLIFDSYDGFRKILDPLYDFTLAKVFYLSKKATPEENQSLFKKILEGMVKLLKDYFAYEDGEINHTPVEPPQTPQPQQPMPIYDWSTSKAVRHSLRVMCDEEKLSVFAKNIICACIEQESGFNPKAIGKRNKNGTTDYGLCQYNDGKNPKTGQAYWIGEGADFKDTDEVLNDPEKNVRVMIREYKKGNIKLWSSYSTGAYKKFL